jgi:hypothetical protein
MMWRAFVLRLLAVFMGGSLALVALLALLDPWGALPFSSPLPRLPADHSQRWAYPELARDRRFDAAIIGDSASRLLNPADFDKAVGARFVNLAMVHAYAFEQARLLDVFIKAHPNPRAVLIGLDRGWCERGDDLEHFGYEPIPEWLYHGDVLAGLGNLLNMHAIETAWRSLSAVLGLSPRPYGPNGYALIDVDFHPYDPALAKALIAKDLALIWPTPATPDPAGWHYVALDWLAQRLDALPADTHKLLVFVPRHHLYPAPGSVGAAMMDECRRRVVEMARQRPNAEVYDFSIPSPVTIEEDRWWDAVHARPATMAQVSKELAAAIEGRASADVRILTPPPSVATSASVQ